MKLPGVAWLPLVAGVLLLSAGQAVAADDVDAAADRLGERLSEAPWRMPHRAPQQRVVQLELQNNAPPRPALDFQRPSRSQSMPVGQLRMTLSDTSSLSFRPRSGGMHVTYREKF